MKRLLLTSIAATLLWGCGATIAEPTFDTAAMDKLLREAVTNGDAIGVSAMVFDEGEVVYEGHFGLGDRERETPVNEDTVWRIYSMTKPVTSALIMDLVEEGKIALDDPAAKYIPQLGQMKVVSLGEDGTPIYKDQTRPITVEDLLLHRAGIAYGIFGGSPVEDAYAAADLFQIDEPMADKMDKLAGLPLIFQPGEAWFYSFSIDVLGRIAEIAGEDTLGNLFQTRFFDPLGMTETGFYVRKDQKPRFVSNYFLKEDGTFGLAEDGQTSDFIGQSAMESGGGGLISIMDDYARFAQMMLQGGIYNGTRILEEATVRQMMTDHMGLGSTYLLPWLGGDTGAGFGYGGSVQVNATRQQQLESGRYPGQWGWGGAARTNMYIDPQNNAFGIIMLQFFSPEDPQLHADFQALALRETRNTPLE